ncbi:MAG: ABC transporter substrate-binding protein [Acidimicrobiia bacterium]|nr:ABC transporter substrate-binding protein [Acidimicrobiia bacterium]
MSAVLGMSLVAAGCGGDSDDGATGDTLNAEVQEGVAAALGSSPTTVRPVVEPASIEEWEELWAAERAAAVERIGAEGWGLSEDGSTVTGPGGMSIDVASCPAGWSNTEGLTDTEVRLGATMPFSGFLADSGNIAKTMTALFQHYSDEGYFTDSEDKARRVSVTVRDDGADPARTIPLVDELIDSEKVFAVTTLGTAPSLRVYDKLNQRCIPQPLAITGHPAWGDPVNHPWTTGSQLAYTTEAVIWGTYIEQHIDEFDGDVKIAALVMENDFGVAWESAFRAYIDQSPLGDQVEFVTQRVEVNAPTMTDAMTTLAAEQPDIFIAMIAGGPCTQVINDAAANGMKDSASYLFLPSVCKASSFVGKDKVGGDGSAADGWLIVGGGVKDFNAEALDDDPYVAWARDMLAEQDVDYRSSGSIGVGFQYMWPLVQAVKLAGELEGGLSRTNLMLALRTMDMTHPTLVPGVGFNMHGADDAYFIEGSDISVWDSEQQVWVQEGEVIDVSGTSGTCAFDASTARCG